MKFVNVFLVVLLSFHLVSCDTDELEPPLNLSSTLIEMEGEGGEAKVSIIGEDWKIAEVVNKNGNGNISGDIYSLDGDQIRENDPLALDSLGRMDALWSNKGFSITRNTLTSLEIVVKENSTGENFNFVVVLESGGELFEITVKQEKSQGYTFDSIEYSLEEGDGDSLYVSKVSKGFEFDVLASRQFSFSPIGGIDIDKRFHFESMEDDAFVWLKNDSIMVKAPTGIHNNEIYFNGEKQLYTNYWIRGPHGFEEQMETITLPAGKSKFSIDVDIEYRTRKLTYTLTLINNRTSEKKIIEGKWIEIAPTGEYEYAVEWQDEVK